MANLVFRFLSQSFLFLCCMTTVQATPSERIVFPYEDAADLPDEGFLHPALFVDDLDAELAKHDVLWGPRTVSGTFGVRRIAFVEAPGGIRLEFMEQLEPPA